MAKGRKFRKTNSAKWQMAGNFDKEICEMAKGKTNREQNLQNGKGREIN